MSEKGNDKSYTDPLVVTPGGLRPASKVHVVGPGQAVYFNQSGQSTVLGAAAPARALQRSTFALPKDYVITPGGPRHKSFVHTVEPNQAVTSINGQPHLVDMVSKSLIPLPKVATPREEIPALASGWITDASSSNDTGSPITFFQTTWIVPKGPRTFTGDLFSPQGQVIFLFNGLQDNPETYILQPVLQWGDSGYGGGKYWSIANWLVDQQHVFKTPNVGVSEGDILNGVMTLTGQSGNLFDYQCEFAGINSFALNVVNRTQLVNAYETLECYGVRHASDYPQAEKTAMTAIEIRNANGEIPPNWSANDLVIDCGQHTIVVSDASPGGEVDIYYFDFPPGHKINDSDSTPCALAPCAFNNHLYLFWKANDSSNSIYFSASPDAQLWPAGKKINNHDSTPQALAACVFNNSLYLFWKANDSSNSIYYSASGNGQSWPGGKKINNHDSTPQALAACVFNNSLYLFWKANDGSNSIYYSASADGQSWPRGQKINGLDSTPAAPAACVFGNQIYVFWKSNDSSNSIYYSRSTNGHSWPNGTKINQTDSTPQALGACVFENQIYLFWEANDPSNSIYFTASADGQSWPTGKNNPDDTNQSPSASIFARQLCVFWKSNDPSNSIFVTHNSQR
jgi:hypothetical protein